MSAERTRPVGGTVRYPPDEPKWLDTGDGFKRAIVFEPGYLDPNTGPKSYGRHGMGIRFLLAGPKGVAQFLMNTGWVPGVKGVPARVADYDPSGWDVGYHAHVPQYEGHEGGGACEYMPGGEPCYYAGSGLAAEPVMEAFIREGDPAVWSVLREWHDSLTTADEADR